jgi:acetyl-CoA carboxylase carboxyl transferase subunit alpha
MANGFLDFEKPIVELERKISELRSYTQESGMDFSQEIATLEGRLISLKEETYKNLTRWQRVMLARHPQRPYSLDYITRIFPDFLELHGDRHYSDDPAMVGGLATFMGRPVTVIGQQKGRDTKENIRRHFGMPYPEGYRKALRLFKSAEKFGRPVILFIDTPGAFPGFEGESRGQAWAIAANLKAMASLAVPTVGILISEGGSGGALGIGVVNRLLMLENAYYSVISPEGCAAILWRDAARAADAADALRLSAKDLVELGIVDQLVEEPMGGAHRDPDEMARRIGEAIEIQLKGLLDLSAQEIVEQRWEKYRHIGAFETGE